MKLIDKDALVAEIEKLRDKVDLSTRHGEGLADAYFAINKILGTLEVKEVDTWHLEEKESIYDAVKSWDLYTFVCVMKDGTIQRFNGSRDEDCEGHISVYINGVNDDYDDVDDIVKWIELKA